MQSYQPLPLPSNLDALKQKNWQHFYEKHPEICQQLSPVELSLCQDALCLSDFVYEQLMLNPQWFLDFLALNLNLDIDFTQAISAKLESCDSEASLHRFLRLFRRKYLTMIAIADLCQLASLRWCLTQLSELADCLIVAAKDWLTKECVNLWGQPQNKAGEKQELLVYAMGKLGGKELNFSSDIDLIFSYPESGQTVGARRVLDNQQFFTRLGQKLLTALNQVTVDGFVYRVDMRLRPFGESGPLVMNFNAMENYYQDQGRDWERYAMLKARLIGDSRFHGVLSNMLRPFVYRRYIDFSVIESFRRMKMMIAQEARRKKRHNNIKLGAGGIREIEFIAQVFQLIRGGRQVQLQERNLLTALALLAQHDCISNESKQVLESAYCFLRESENAIQAFADEQTQELPSDDKNQARLALRMGCRDWAEYEEKCQWHMQKVNAEFAALIGEESEQSHDASEHWVTYWLANWDDEDCLSWIRKQQPEWPAVELHRQLTLFKSELKKRSIGPRGRHTIDKLIPVLIELLAEQHDPLLTLERTLLVLAKITTRTAYLELLYENAMAFKQLLKLCSASEWIAQHLAQYPLLLDELIDPKLLYAIPAVTDYRTLLSEALIRIPEDDLEAQMEGLRQFKQTQQLKIAAADISGILPIMKVSDHLTAVAEALIDEVVNMAWHQMVHRFGQPNQTLGTDNKQFGVIGYGKLGGIELGYSSDLDLVFVHNARLDDVTNGEKSVSSVQFYLKLSQRIVHLFHTRTSNGYLYEADMRLRPSGNSGAMVVHIDSFENYQSNEAWTWEHQALVRARMVVADEELAQRFEHIRLQILQTPRELGELAKAVADMRDKMRQHLDQSKDDLFDLKQGQGGLADIEFLAQFLVLANAHKSTDLCQYSDNIRIFEQLNKHQLLTTDDAELLTKVYCQLRDWGHARSLQNQNMLLSTALLQDERARIKTIWQRFLTPA